MLAVLFNCVAGLTLFLFAVHYVYYILSALTTQLEQPPASAPTSGQFSKKNQQQQHSMQQTEDAKFIKKRLKAGSIEPHPTEKAIILNYQLEATVYAKPGDPMLEESKSCQRIIRLRTLSARTDSRALAREVVDKCDIIHRSQLAEVEQIIYYLKNRRDIDNNCSSGGTDNNSSNMSFASARPKSRSTSKVNTSGRHYGSAVAVANQATAQPTGQTAVKEKPSIRNLEEYVELLYEDLPERIHGSDLILRLARYADNLEELEKNEAMLSALARVLREDWRKSLELSTNIIYIFFCFSSYTQFHPVIVQYRIGSLCMDIIDYELKRYESMKNDLETRRNPDSNKVRDAAVGAAQISSAAATSTNNNNNSRSQSDFLDAIADEPRPKEMEPPRRRIPELKQRPKSGNWSSQSSLMSASLRSLNSSYHENLAAMASSSGGASFDSASPSPTLSTAASGEDVNVTMSQQQQQQLQQKTKEDYERLNKQFKVFTMKQEQLLRVAIYLLLNIAENTKFEEKMRKKNIVRILCKALERDNVEVLILVVTFMKKLSIVRDNKNDMFEMNVVDRLPRLLQINNVDLVQVTLRFMFNLSFDAALRGRMIRLGLLAKLVTFMSADQHHDIVVRILYHMSLDDKVKSMFTYTECIPLATDMLILSLNQKADRDLAALCINLALNKRNAQLMTENRRLPTLMGKAFRYQDTLLLKILRNVSTHETLRGQFVDFVGDLARALTECSDEPFVVECVGILGNLSLPDLDYSMILHDFNLIPWMRAVLVPHQTADDLVLDTVVLLGTCACDEACAMLLCKAEVILSLIELLKAKQEDDEMVLQIVFVFQQILCHESTRDYMIRETESPAYLIDLMHDKNVEIRKVCEFCLDVIAVADGEWASRIKLEKFRSHNAQWMNMVETQQELDEEESASYYDSMGADGAGDGEAGGGGGFGTDAMPAYLTTSSFLEEYMLYQSSEDGSGSTGGGVGGRPASSGGGDLDLTDRSKMEIDVE